VAPNGTTFQWSGKAEQVALLVAQDEQTDVEIATACKIGKRTLERWKHRPEFLARVQEHRDTWRAEIKAKGIADRQNRVDALNDRHERMQRVIEARADELADVPGGNTGLLVRQAKLVKVYETAGPPPADQAAAEGETLYSAKRDVIVYEYAVDTGLLKEMRETEKQAAQDLGQWTEKQEHAGEILVRQYIGVDVEQV
jgi:hypothetical protein